MGHTPARPFESRGRPWQPGRYRIEHAIIKVFGDKAKKLNEVGRDGWELVTIAEIEDIDYFIFKRQVAAT